MNDQAQEAKRLFTHAQEMRTPHREELSDVFKYTRSDREFERVGGVAPDPTSFTTAPLLNAQTTSSRRCGC
jgi:hypothetical protein